MGVHINLQLTEGELGKYKDLMDNLNGLLGNVYYIYQKKSDGSSVWGTGFSIEYKGKYYLITAGHAVDGEYGIFKNLRFKANHSNEWIYPKLITYNNNYMDGEDYAIFYSDKVDNGLNIDYDDDRGVYVLGSSKMDINAVKNIYVDIDEGESGSPVIDLDGEIVEIATTDLYYYNTDINLVLEAIDNLK